MNQTTTLLDDNDVLLDVQGLSKSYEVRSHLSRRLIGTVRAVDDMSFQIRRGETVGLVGESGCGKTTTARCILRAVEPSVGRIIYYDGLRRIDVAALRGGALRAFRRHMQLIFQDPFSSLNPRMTVMQIVGEPLRIHRMASRGQIEQRVRELMTAVGLDPRFLNRYPHAFSGGQRQRIGIARAMALQPSLIVADEAVSALDMSMQAQILNLLKDLQNRMQLTYLFIAHDLSVVRHFCDRVLVMYAGRIVEAASTEELFVAPQHPYTESLLSAAPRADPDAKSDRIILGGEVPDPANRPTGCPFHPRCRFAEPRCQEEEPPFREVAPDRDAACHYSERLAMEGIV